MKKIFIGFILVSCFLLALSGCKPTDDNKASESASPAVTLPAATPASDSQGGLDTNFVYNGAYPTADELNETITNYRFSYTASYGGETSGNFSKTQTRFGDVVCDLYVFDNGSSLEYFDVKKELYYFLFVDQKTGYGFEMEETMLESCRQFSGTSSELLRFLWEETETMNKNGSEQIATRNTTIYSYETENEGTKYSYTLWVDDEYGLTLKYMCKETDSSGKTAITLEFEVTELSIGSITAADLPDLGEYEIEMR